MEMLLPRTCRIAPSSRAARSSPRSSTRPPPMRPGSGTSRMMASAVMLLPQPDSPTRHSVSPGRSSKLTALSTSALRPRARKASVRFSTRSTGSAAPATGASPGVIACRTAAFIAVPWTPD